MVRCIGHSWHLYSWRCWCIHFCPPFFGCQRFFDSWRRHLDQPGLKQVPSLFTSWTWWGKTGKKQNKRKKPGEDVLEDVGCKWLWADILEITYLVFLCLLTGAFFLSWLVWNARDECFCFCSPSLLVERRPNFEREGGFKLRELTPN